MPYIYNPFTNKLDYHLDDADYLKKDGSVPLTGPWDIGSGRQIQAETIRSRKTGGLRLGGYDVTETEIDFTSPAWTEVDPNNHISIAADKITFTGLHTNETAYVYYDYTAGYFDGDFRQELKLELTHVDDAAIPVLWMMANDLGDMQTLRLANKDFLGIYAYFYAGYPAFTLIERDGAAEYSHVWNGAYDTTYYVTFVRDESVGTYGTLYCYLYTDSGRTVLAAKLEITLHTSKKDFRYLYGVNSYNNAGGNAADGYTQNLKLSTDPFGIEKGIYVHDDGTVDMEMQSGCRVALDTNQAIAAGVSEEIIYDTEYYDIQNEYNLSTGRFTTKESGRYLVTVSTAYYVGAANDLIYVSILVNGSTRLWAMKFANTAGTQNIAAPSLIVELDANDYISSKALNATNNDTVYGNVQYTNMSIAKVG